MEIHFLTLEDALFLHAESIERWGGTMGLRDEGLLISALEQPRAMFDNRYLHEHIEDMGSAYLFHIVCNHPFLDGNKRTGFLCAHSFLRKNGRAFLSTSEPDDASLYALVMGVANGTVTKAEISERFKEWYCNILVNL